MSKKENKTRKKIIEAARQMLEEDTGKGARMSDIARAAGVSRQAVYLHFKSRTELLIATTQYMDDLLGLEERLKPYREATAGVDRLEAYIVFWGNYIPEIYNVAKAMLAAQETDDAARAAWSNRMLAMKDGCRTVIETLNKDGMLHDEWTLPKAIDTLWTMLSVRSWEQLTLQCGWSNNEYIKWTQMIAIRTFVNQ